jgi:hypothetical protein
VIALLVALSVVLTGSVLDPSLGTGQILAILGGCAAVSLGLAGVLGIKALRSRRELAWNGFAPDRPDQIDRTGREDWRMPPLAELGAAQISRGRRISLAVLRTYLALATVLVVVKLVALALGH